MPEQADRNARIATLVMGWSLCPFKDTSEPGFDEHENACEHDYINIRDYGWVDDADKRMPDFHTYEGFGLILERMQELGWSFQAVGPDEDGGNWLVLLTNPGRGVGEIAPTLPEAALEAALAAMSSAGLCTCLTAGTLRIGADVPSLAYSPGRIRGAWLSGWPGRSFDGCSSSGWRITLPRRSVGSAWARWRS